MRRVIIICNIFEKLAKLDNCSGYDKPMEGYGEGARDDCADPPSDHSLPPDHSDP